MRTTTPRSWLAALLALVALLAIGVLPASAGSLNVTFNVTNVDFGSVTTGTSATAQAVVTNTTAFTLYLGAAEVHGGESGDFGLSSTGCAGAIAAGASCDLSVTFTPAEAGPRTTALWVTLNAHNKAGATVAHATVAASLVGAGIAPSISLADADAGSVAVGGTGTADALLTNNSSVPVVVHAWSLVGVVHADFSISSIACPDPLEPGQSCDVVVDFTPATTGDASATLNVWVAVSGTPGPTVLEAQATVSGTGASSGASPAATLSDLNVGSVTLGTSTTGEVSLTDTGVNPITLKRDGVTGNALKEFTVDSAGCSAELTTGQSCNLVVTFTPSVAKLRSATLGVAVVVHASKNTTATATASLTGTGVKPTASLTSPGAGAVTIGAATTVDVTVTNDSLVPMTYHRTVLAGPHLPSWSVSSTTCDGSLSAGASCDVYLTFAPHAQGDLSIGIVTQLTIGAGSRTVTIDGATDVTGTGVVPTFTVAVGTLGPTAPHVAVTGTATITNTSDVTLSYKAAAFGGGDHGDFSVTGTTCAAALLPADSCTLTVRFDPTQSRSGTRSSVLDVVTVIDGVSPTHNVALATRVTGNES